LRAVSIIGYDQVGKSGSIPFVGDIVHETGWVIEQIHGLVGPLSGVDTTNEEEDVDQK